MVTNEKTRVFGHKLFQKSKKDIYKCPFFIFSGRVVQNHLFFNFLIKKIYPLKYYYCNSIILTRYLITYYFLYKKRRKKPEKISKNPIHPPFSPIFPTPKTRICKKGG